jgi:hypothetical protein
MAISRPVSGAHMRQAFAFCKCEFDLPSVISAPGIGCGWAIFALIQVQVSPFVTVGNRVWR